MLRAVIDTNVLLEGLTHKGVAGRVVDAWASRRFLPCVSTALALEYEEVLLRRFPQSRHSTVTAALQALLVRAEYVPIFFRLRPASPDPDDDFVLECAFNGRAALVTSNVKDFRGPAASVKVDILTSESFVSQLQRQER